MVRTLSLNKEKRMMMAFWLVLFFMIASRQLTVLGTTYLMGEDASCFLNRALEKGIFSVFIPNTGYIQIIPQFVTWISLMMSRFLGQGIQLVPYFMMFTALTIETVFVAKICSKDFRWLVEKDFYRLVMALAAVLLTSDKAFEVWHNITCWQWWSGFYIMLIGIKLLHDRELSVNNTELVALILIGLSTPLAVVTVCIFSFIIFLKVIKKQYNRGNIRNDAAKYICIVLPCCIQGIFTLLDKRTDTGVSILSNLFSAAKSMIASIPASVLYPDYLNQLYQKSGTDSHAVYAALGFGLFVWVLVFAVYLKNKKVHLFIYELIFAYGIVLLGYISNGAYIDESIFWNANAGRYLFIPQMCFAFLLAYAVFLMAEKQMIIITASCISYLIVICMLHFQIIDQAEFSDIYHENSWLYSDHGADTCSIQVNPPGLMWGRFNMPVDFSKYEEICVTDDRKNAEVNFVFFDEWQSTLTKQVLGEHEYINIKGWCVDGTNESNPSNVVIGLNGNYFAALLQESEYVDDYKQGQGKYLNSGFTVWVPSNVLCEGSNEGSIYGFNREKEYYERTDFIIEVKK